MREIIGHCLQIVPLFSDDINPDLQGNTMSNSMYLSHKTKRNRLLAKKNVPFEIQCML